jgi:hypothetical protein
MLVIWLLLEKLSLQEKERFPSASWREVVVLNRVCKKIYPVISLFLPYATSRTLSDSIFLARRRCSQKEKSIMLILVQSMRPSFSPTQPLFKKSLL